MLIYVFIENYRNYFKNLTLGSKKSTKSTAIKLPKVFEKTSIISGCLFTVTKPCNNSIIMPINKLKIKN